MVQGPLNRQPLSLSLANDNKHSSELKSTKMAPKRKPGRPKKTVDTAAIPADDEEVDGSPPQKKFKASQSPTKEDLFQKPIKKQSSDAQVARTQGLAIPIDDGCPLACESFSPLCSKLCGFYC